MGANRSAGRGGSVAGKATGWDNLQGSKEARDLWKDQDNTSGQAQLSGLVFPCVRVCLCVCVCPCLKEDTNHRKASVLRIHNSREVNRPLWKSSIFPPDCFLSPH